MAGREHKKYPTGLIWLHALTGASEPAGGICRNSTKSACTAQGDKAFRSTFILSCAPPKSKHKKEEIEHGNII